MPHAKPLDPADRLETITNLVVAMIRTYDGSPSLHSVIPFVSLMRMWLAQSAEETPAQEEEE
jgi:hypothetical protein